MLMQILTNAAALAYVAEIETRWYGTAPEIIASTPCLVNGWEDCPGIDVYTANNHWSVWIEPNGEVYGEC